MHFAATIERAEKQIILAKQARRLLNLVDDTPIVPGESHPPFEGTEAGRQILNDTEDELRNYQPHLEPITSNAGSLGAGAMPGATMSGAVNYEGESEHDITAQPETPYEEKTNASLGASGEGQPVVAGESSVAQEEASVPASKPELTETDKRQAEAGVV